MPIGERLFVGFQLQLQIEHHPDGLGYWATGEPVRSDAERHPPFLLDAAQERVHVDPVLFDLGARHISLPRLLQIVVQRSRFVHDIGDPDSAYRRSLRLACLVEDSRSSYGTEEILVPPFVFDDLHKDLVDGVGMGIMHTPSDSRSPPGFLSLQFATVRPVGQLFRSQHVVSSQSMP